MSIEVAQGVLLPFVGTFLGAACVLFMSGTFSRKLQSAMNGFAAGVMAAASIWSLLIPAIEQSAYLQVLSFVPAAVGFWLGILFLLLIDRLIGRLQRCYGGSYAPGTGKRTAMLVLAVTIHNIPEGLAVGVAFAGWLSGNRAITLAGAFALSLGIAVQNFPEGAIVSMPLKAGGMSRCRAFVCGGLSGLVEPIAAVAAIFAAGCVVPVMPYLLSFAAGAMFYVIVEELLAKPQKGHSCGRVLCFAAGFTLMLALDVALG